MLLEVLPQCNEQSHQASAPPPKKKSFAASKLSEASSSGDPCAWYTGQQSSSLAIVLTATKYYSQARGTGPHLRWPMTSTHMCFCVIASSLPPLDREQLPTFLPARSPAPTATRSKLRWELFHIDQGQVGSRTGWAQQTHQCLCI